MQDLAQVDNPDISAKLAALIDEIKKQKGLVPEGPIATPDVELEPREDIPLAPAHIGPYILIMQDEKGYTEVDLVSNIQITNNGQIENLTAIVRLDNLLRNHTDPLTGNLALVLGTTRGLKDAVRAAWQGQGPNLAEPGAVSLGKAQLYRENTYDDLRPLHISATTEVLKVGAFKLQLPSTGDAKTQANRQELGKTIWNTSVTAQNVYDAAIRVSERLSQPQMQIHLSQQRTALRNNISPSDHFVLTIPQEAPVKV